MPQPGAQAEVTGIVMTGGASRGRGRGLATVFVEASDELRAVQESYAAETGEIPVQGEGRRRRVESS